MKRFNIIVSIIFVLGALVVVSVLFASKNNKQNPTLTSDSVKQDRIAKPQAEKPSPSNTAVIPRQPASLKVVTPTPNQLVTSPLVVTGQASAWYFEAVFPVRVTDEKGNILGSGQAKALGDWMTADFVPFSGAITFDAKDAARGFVVFEKDNPSGLPENYLSFSLPVNFK